MGHNTVSDVVIMHGGKQVGYCHQRTPETMEMILAALLPCRTSQVARLLSSKNYSRRDHIGIYVGIQEILSSKSNTSSSINRSEHPAAGRREKSTPTSSFKSGYK